MEGQWKTIELPTVYGDTRTIEAYCDEKWAVHQSPEEMQSPDFASWCVTDLASASVTFLVPTFESGEQVVDLAGKHDLSYANEDGVGEMILLCHHIMANDIEAYVAKPTNDGMAQLVSAQELLLHTMFQSLEGAWQEPTNGEEDEDDD